jgi:hypothetical protein
MTKQKQIHRDLLAESSYTPNGTMITCNNHVMRRNFRLYIDGSYRGQTHYMQNCDLLREIKTQPRKLRSFVICNFLELISSDFECSYSTAQRAVVSAFPASELEKLNAALIEDALDLIAD